MEQLLSTYAVGDILIIIITLGVFIFGIIKGWSFLKDEKNKFISDENKKIEAYERIDELERQNQSQQKDIDSLLESDNIQLQGEILKQYKEAMEKGHIDLNTLDYIENCFKIYEGRGGNSFVHDIIIDVRKLPKDV